MFSRNGWIRKLFEAYDKKGDEEALDLLILIRWGAAGNDTEVLERFAELAEEFPGVMAAILTTTSQRKVSLYSR